MHAKSRNCMRINGRNTKSRSRRPLRSQPSDAPSAASELSTIRSQTITSREHPISVSYAGPRLIACGRCHDKSDVVFERDFYVHSDNRLYMPECIRLYPEAPRKSSEVDKTVKEGRALIIASSLLESLTDD